MCRDYPAALRGLIAAHRLTQRAAASLLGVSARTVEGYLNGTRTPTGPVRRILDRLVAGGPEVEVEIRQAKERHPDRRAGNRVRRPQPA